jgi:hypothetical protein
MRAAMITELMNIVLLVSIFFCNLPPPFVQGKPFAGNQEVTSRQTRNLSLSPRLKKQLEIRDIPYIKYGCLSSRFHHKSPPTSRHKAKVKQVSLQCRY